MQKDGCYASPEGWPQWCGLEVSGEVVAAPADAKVRPGDKVCALLGGGGYSELVAVPAGMVIPVPEGLSMVEAASLPEVWSTVYLNLMHEAGGMKPGDVFYVQAGASGRRPRRDPVRQTDGGRSHHHRRFPRKSGIRAQARG